MPMSSFAAGLIANANKSKYRLRARQGEGARLCGE